MAKLVLGGDNGSVTPAFHILQNKKKFGFTIDDFIGDIDSNGVFLGFQTENAMFDGSGIKDFSTRSAYLLFRQNPIIRSVILPDLIQISGDYACCQMFHATSVEGHIDLSKLETITGTYACNSMFNDTQIESIDLSSLTVLNTEYACANMCDACYSLRTIDLRNLKTISGNHICSHMFRNCVNVESIALQNLESINGSYAAYCMFDIQASYYYGTIASLDLSKLKTITGTYACNSMFQNHKNLESVKLDSLEVIGASTDSSVCYGMFKGCEKLKNISFPKLTTIFGSETLKSFLSGTAIETISFPLLQNIDRTDAFGSSYYAMFKNCSQLTEIHFRADMQATIEGLVNYENKFGAENATIYFDL